MVNGKPLHFTRHVVERMEERGLTEELIAGVLEKGIMSDGNDETTKVFTHNEMIVVISEKPKQVNVVSCKYSRKVTRMAEAMGERTGLGFHKALQMMDKRTGKIRIKL